MRTIRGPNISTAVLRNAAIVSVSLFLLAACDRSPELTISSAEQAWSNGDFRSVVVQLKALLQKEPDNLRARWMLGEVYLEIEDGPSAEKELRLARQLGVNDDAAVPALARALLLQDKAAEVISLDHDGVLSPLSSAELGASRALALAAEEQLDKARAEIEAAIAAAPDSPWVKLAQARLLRRDANYTEAALTLNALLAAHSDYGLAWSELARIQESKGELASAESAYTRALAHRTSTFSDQLRRGFVRAAQGNIDGAAEDADQLLRRAPKSPAVQALIGMVRFQQEKYSEAADAFEIAYSGADRDLRVMMFLAASHWRLGNAVRAQNLAARLVNAAPRFIPGRKLLAAIYLQESKIEEAEELIRPVVEAKADDLYAKNLLATILIRQQKIDEAAGILEEIAFRQDDEPLVLSRAGAALLSAGREDEALAALGKASELAPGEAMISSIVIGSLLQGQLVDEALAAAEQFAKRKPDDPQAWNLLGAAYLAREEFTEARRVFEKALALRPGDATAEANLAITALRVDDRGAAREHLERGIDANPDNARLLYALALIELADRRSDEAQRRLVQSVAADPDLFAPRVVLAQLLLRQGEADRVIDLLSREGLDRNPEVLFIRAEALFQLELFFDARNTLEMLNRHFPDSPEVLFGLSRVYAELGDRELLETALDRVLELAPDSPRATLAKARLQILDKDFEEADRTLEGLEENAADEPEVLATRLTLERTRGDHGEELGVARRLFDLSPSTATVLALVRAETSSGQYAAAESRLKNWISSHPKDVASMQVLAELYIGLGRSDEGIKMLQRILVEDPDNVVVLNDLAWHVRDADPAAALVHATRAYGLAPESVSILDTYADVLARNQQKELAIEIMERALRLDGNNATLKLRYAQVLELVGERARAVEEAEKIAGGRDVPKAIQDRAAALLDRWKG
jgi:putative PEP-CTERM system TPR-repeat lipoprotein